MGTVGGSVEPTDACAVVRRSHHESARVLHELNYASSLSSRGYVSTASVAGFRAKAGIVARTKGTDNGAAEVY